MKRSDMGAGFMLSAVFTFCVILLAGGLSGCGGVKYPPTLKTLPSGRVVKVSAVENKDAMVTIGKEEARPLPKGEPGGRAAGRGKRGLIPYE